MWFLFVAFFLRVQHASWSPGNWWNKDKPIVATRQHTYGYGCQVNPQRPDQCPPQDTTCFAGTVCGVNAVVSQDSGKRARFMQWAGKWQGSPASSSVGTNSAPRQWTRRSLDIMCYLYRMRSQRVTLNEIQELMPDDYRKDGKGFEAPPEIDVLARVGQAPRGEQWAVHIFDNTWNRYTFGRDGACEIRCNCMLNGRAFETEEEYDAWRFQAYHHKKDRSDRTDGLRRALSAEDVARSLWSQQHLAWRQHKIHALPSPVAKTSRRALGRSTFSYLSCHIDQHARNFPYGPRAQGDTSSYSPWECASRCSGYPYFALQYGGECFCGNTYGGEGYEEVSDSECMRDEGLVGNGWRNAVYSNIDEFVCPYGFVSTSYNLDGEGKIWHFNGRDSSRSAEDCADICLNRVGCTSFEYASSGSYVGSCATYTHAQQNIRGDENRHLWNEMQGDTAWRSCLRLDPWRRCGEEGGSCSCNGVVAYGHGDHWYEKSVRGSISCTNGEFGDPFLGQHKTCFCDETPAWRHCAIEGQGNCQCNGLIAYGVQDKWVTQLVHGSVPCNNAQFGDPFPGQQKVCQCDEGRSIPDNMLAPGANFINGFPVSSDVFNQVESLASQFVPSQPNSNPTPNVPSDWNPFNWG